MQKGRILYFVLNIALSLALFFRASSSAREAQAAGVCGTGTWTSGNLEIHHINIGQGDATLIVSPAGKSLLFDAGESTWNSSTKAQIIGPYIGTVLGCKSLDYVLISHFHLDHIGYAGYGGLWHLVEKQGFSVGTTLVRNYQNYLGDTSGTFTNWKAYLEGAGQAKLHPVTALEGTGQVNLGANVSVNILALDGNGALLPGNFQGDSHPPSENDYSIGAVLSYGQFDEWIGGDLSGAYEVGGFGYTYHDIELGAAPEIGDVDVYRVNHHGSAHSSSATFISQLDPEISILSLGNSNSYGHPAQPVMDRLLGTSTVYMTQRGDPDTNIGNAIVAGHVVIKTSNGLHYTVNGTAFTATEPARNDTDGDGYFAEADPNDTNSGLLPSPNGGCNSLYQTCFTASTSCQVTPGQVVINEVFPSPSSNGIEWVELYNTTTSAIHLGYCFIDDIPAGGMPAYQIPASTLIPPRGFWTLDRTSYFNNTGDQVRFLKEDGSTILDSHSYGNTAHNLAWYRLPDGGNWAASPAASSTKGQSNTIPFYPIVSSILRTDENPTNANSVRFTLTFSKAVTGVNTTAPFNDFALHTTGLTGTSIAAVSGSGATYTVTVNTGTGSGTIRLDLLDNDSIRDASNQPLGGSGAGNGNFAGETYTVTHQVAISGNAGVASATLNYTGGSTTVDSNGNYSFIVPTGWSGTVTPSKPNYSFSPTRRTYTNVMSDQVAQNYTATKLFYSISGNTGAGGVTLSYINGTPKTIISQPNGSYSFQVPRGWSGTVTPSKNGYIFSPGNRPYNNLLSDQIAQNYTATPLYSISGNVGVSGVTLTYSNGATKTVTSQANGSYSFTVPGGWSGTVTPSHPCFTFTPSERTYTNLADSQTVQDYAPTIVSGCADIHTEIGGAHQGRFGIEPDASTRASFTGLNNGPVQIESTNAIPLIGAERVIYKVNGVNTSFSEMMGLPAAQVDTTYWLPWYNNVDLDTQIRLANVSASTATIHVYIGGAEVQDSPFTLLPGESTRKSFAGVNAGPVQIVSDQDLVAAERVIYKVNGVNTSFTETMALPDSQLDTTYWLP